MYLQGFEMGLSFREQGKPAPQELDERESVAAWRLTRLLDARGRAYDQPFSLEHLDALSKVAASDADLHKACAALVEGCDPQTLADIYS